MVKDGNKTSSRSSRRRNSKRRSTESPNIQQTVGSDDSIIDDTISLRRSQTADPLMWSPFIEGDNLKIDPFAEVDTLKNIPFTEEASANDDDEDASQDSSTSPWKIRSPPESNGLSRAHSPSRSRSCPTSKEEEMAARRKALENARRRNDEMSRKIDEMVGTSETSYRRQTSPYYSTTDDSSESNGSGEKTTGPENTQTTEYDLSNSTRVILSFTFRVEWILPLCLIIGVIVGGVVAYFIARPESTLPAVSDLSSSQSQPPSLSPSSSPTREFLFDPPLPDDCDRVRIGTAVLGQEMLTERNFDITLDVTMRAQVGQTETMELLKWEIQKKLIPKLVGCEAQNRKLRENRVLSNPNRYIVGDGKVQFRPESLEENEECSSEMCFSGTFNMDLYLKTAAEQYFVIVNLVSDIFGDNLVDSLELESPAFVSVVARSVINTYPSTIPSSTPSLVPSASPSHEPSTTPSVTPSLIPSTSPSHEPTKLPSELPTLAPTPRRPTASPTHGPTLSPTVSVSPTTTPPTRIPSMHPTLAPTAHPTPPPTPSPTVSPSRGPTLTPTMTGSPTAAPPSRMPTMNPSLVPTAYPTPPPTPSPTMVPSSSPTGEEDRKGYFHQLDRPIRVSCAGDSLTRGRSGGNPAAFTYPSQLRQMLGENFEVHNFGRNAVTAIRGHSLSYVDMTQFQSSLDVEPDIYLLMLGTNDSRYWQEQAHKFRGDMEFIVNQVRGVSPGSPPRIIVAIPPWVKTDVYGIRNDILANNVQPEIRALVRQENLQLVNMYDITYNQADHFVSDGLHLNQKGYGALAANWKAAIECNQNGMCEVGETCSSCPGDCYLNCS